MARNVSKKIVLAAIGEIAIQGELIGKKKDECRCMITVVLAGSALAACSRTVPETEMRQKIINGKREMMKFSQLLHYGMQKISEAR